MEGGTVEQAVIVALRKIRADHGLWRGRFFARQPSWLKTESKSYAGAEFLPSPMQSQTGMVSQVLLV
jgi:hypothetical protein